MSYLLSFETCLGVFPSDLVSPVQMCKNLKKARALDERVIHPGHLALIYCSFGRRLVNAPVIANFFLDGFKLYAPETEGI